MSGTLFEMEEDEDPFNGTKHPIRPCTPARPGTGPAGETCRTCAHRRQIKVANTYQKCGLMERHWTGGTGTDIKAAWAACNHWQPLNPWSDR